jgi:hypothetical protein
MSDVDPLAIRQHLTVIFGKLPQAGFICVRGIGEKGTDGEGEFRDDKFIDLSKVADPAADIERHVRRWSEHSRASFIVPAILSADRGTSENVADFRSVLVDLDSGDIADKQSFLERQMGKATAVVMSGGEVDGQAKRHLYWTLNAPCHDVSAIVRLRDEIARKGGGDIQFGLGVDSNPYGRAHQPVRIAGSVHSKNNVRNPVRIEMPADPQVYGIQRLKDGIMLSPRHDGALIEQATETMLQSDKPALDLTKKVYEGGDEEGNRWSQFSRVCGHYLHTARRGEVTLDEAKAGVLGWMETSMVPPWPLHRADREWHAILQRDLANHGPMPEPVRPMIDNGDGLEVWAAHRWSMTEKPKRRFLVDGLILAGKHQLLVAEGGAGKTFLMLDLAIKVSSYQDNEYLDWCGGQIREGGTVVILTTEDDKDELHIRLADIDPDKRREKAGDKLIVLPTINSGGAFAIVEKDPKTQEAKPSRRWAEFFALLRRLPDLKLLVVDTLNSTLHGEENSATIINEFVRVASQVCGELGAALILTHHIRKQGDEPIRNVEQMKAAVRGSSALLAAFRAGIGIWHCPDFDRRLTAMGLPPKRGQLWKAAVIKANNPEMFDGEKTLLRTDSGLLIDVTNRDQYSSVNMGERHAWLALAIEEAARAGHPYSVEGKNAKSGLYRRRNELPLPLRQVGPGEFQHLVDDLLNKKILAACAAKGGRDKKWLDIPTGPIATDEAGAEISSGAYRNPKWECWNYNPDVNVCVRA